MKVLDLFSGIGGFSLGLERAGMKTIAFCEIIPAKQARLRRLFPGVYVHDDVRTLTYRDGVLYNKVTGYEIYRGVIDVISAGFPCQDIAICGTGKGLDGEKSGLWSEVDRLVGEIRPSDLILENSPEILDPRWMGRLLGDLAALGYDAEWDVLPASAFGAFHRRERFYLVAYPGGAGRGKQYLSTLAGEAEQREYTFHPLQNGFFWPEAEPPVLREGDDVPGRLDRIESLGNTVVPIIPELIGRAIMGPS